MKKFSILVLMTSVIAISAQTTQIDSVQIFSQARRTDAVAFQNVGLKNLQNREPSIILSQNTPGVTAYSDNGSGLGYTYYRIRGIDQTRINTMFDGVPMNEPEDQGAYFSNYPDLWNSLTQVQVQKGIGLSRNGTASYGGSLQLFSPDLKSKGLEIGGNYGSWNASRVYAKYQTPGLELRVSEQYSDGYKYDSKNHGQSIFLSTGFDTSRSTWKFTGFAGNQRNLQSWLGTTMEQIKEDPRTNANKQEKDHFFQSFFQVFNSTRFDSTTELQSSIYYTYLRGNYDFDLNNFLGINDQGDVYNYALESNLVGMYSTLKKSMGNFTTTLGINTNIYSRSHTGTEHSQGWLYKNTGYKNDLSTFVQLSYKFERFRVFTDLQYRVAEFRYSGDQTLNPTTWSFLNPRVGLSYTKGKSEIYTSLGKVGREPTRNDMFGGEDNFTGTLGITQPEYVTDLELGYRYTSKNLSLSLNGFWMKFRDEIVLKGQFGTNSLALNQSVDRSLRAGLEFSGLYKFGKFETQNNSSWIRTQIKESDNTYRHILTPEWIVNQSLTYNLGQFRLGVDGRYQSSSWIDFKNTTTIPDYIILNSSLFWNQGKYSVGVFVNNLTNRQYFNSAYLDGDVPKYFVQMPLNFMISLKYKL